MINKGVFLYLLKLVKYCTIPNKRLFLCNMKFRILFVVFALACFFAACKSDPPFDADAQRAIDDDIIVKFLDSAQIKATKTPSGLYYVILKDTIGEKSIPLTDTVFIHYVGRMLKTRALFDSSRTLTDTATNLSKNLFSIQLLPHGLRGYHWLRLKAGSGCLFLLHWLMAILK